MTKRSHGDGSIQQRGENWSRTSIFGRETFQRDSLQIEATLYRDAVQ